MVFQKPNPFPKSIYDNVAYGPRIHGSPHEGGPRRDREVEPREGGLWNEVKDRLPTPAPASPAASSSGSASRAPSPSNPEVLLMDEPCSALDPIATAQVEELIDELRQNFSIVIVTHSMQQAARVSQRTAFFHLGNLVEYGETGEIFTNPNDKRTQDYITGRIG